VFRSFFFDGSKASFFAVGLVLAIGLFMLKERRRWWGRVLAQWPLYLWAIGPISVYLLVHIEPRYVIGPLIVLLTAPFFPLVLPTPLISKRAGYALLFAVAVGSAGILAVNKKEVVQRIVNDETNLSDPGWKLGCSLAQFGAYPGDKVAAVGIGPSLDATWACVGGVHIVAEIGNNAFDPQDQEKDLQLFTSDPDVQNTVFHLFRQAGAILVVARGFDRTPHGVGWEQIPKTTWWIHRL
jgi:hypothetical protein